MTIFKYLSLSACALCISCASKLLILWWKKKRKYLAYFVSDPENIIILGVAQVGNMVDINQALSQPEAAFYVSAFVVV